MSFDEYLNAGSTELAELGIARVDYQEVDDASEGVTAVLIGDDEYPVQLTRGPNPPVILYVRGNLSALSLGIGVVGTREAGDIARATVPPCIAAAKELGVTVFSGLAKGVDAMAHRGAVDSGVTTVAVLATYPTHVTPTANIALSKEILDSGGAVISESRQSVPRAGLYFARNRIIAGLSSVVIPAEASLKSGTMGTVADALEWGRCLVVPVPSIARRNLPGAEALLALAGETVSPLQGLRVSAGLRGEIEKRGWIANACAATPGELRQFICLGHWFSPFNETAQASV
jgi:DNA processing protein